MLLDVAFAAVPDCPAPIAPAACPAWAPAAEAVAETIEMGDWCDRLAWCELVERGLPVAPPMGQLGLFDLEG